MCGNNGKFKNRFRKAEKDYTTSQPQLGVCTRDKEINVVAVKDSDLFWG
jgi:hypothetical protein